MGTMTCFVGVVADHLVRGRVHPTRVDSIAAFFHRYRIRTLYKMVTFLEDVRNGLHPTPAGIPPFRLLQIADMVLTAVTIKGQPRAKSPCRMVFPYSCLLWDLLPFKTAFDNLQHILPVTVPSHPVVCYKHGVPQGLLWVNFPRLVRGRRDCVPPCRCHRPDVQHLIPAGHQHAITASTAPLDLVYDPARHHIPLATLKWLFTKGFKYRHGDVSTQPFTPQDKGVMLLQLQQGIQKYKERLSPHYPGQSAAVSQWATALLQHLTLVCRVI